MELLAKLQDLINETEQQATAWYANTEQIEALRKDILQVLSEDDLTISELASQIKITTPTIRNFVRTGKAHVRTFTRMEKFIASRKKKKTDSHN